MYIYIYIYLYNIYIYIYRAVRAPETLPPDTQPPKALRIRKLRMSASKFQWDSLWT